MHDKIKVCILMPNHWSGVMGGAEYQAECIIEALHASGRYEIYFLARHVDPLYVSSNHKVIQISNPFGIKRSKFFVDASSINKILQKIKPDIIYQRVGMAYTGIAARYAKKHGIKLFWHIARDDDVMLYKFKLSRQMIWEFIDKKFLEYGVRNATHIIAQTYDQEEILKKYFARTASAVIYNFHPLPVEKIKKSKAIQIVWVANLKANKRPEIFLSLASDLRDLYNVEFIMIGEIHGGRLWRWKMRKQVNQADSVNYMGKLAQDKVNQILSSAHILVNTSKLEGFPNTFIQAWMRKVPVVSLSINPDGVFDQHEVGLCSTTYERLKDDVRRLTLDNELRSRMGKYAQEYAFKNHSDNMAQRLIALFESNESKN